MLAVSHWNSSFCDNLFLKTEISAMIAVTMHLAPDSTDAGRARGRRGLGACAPLTDLATPFLPSGSKERNFGWGVSATL